MSVTALPASAARSTRRALSAGDATFHAGWTIHSAGPNPTDTMRSVMTVIYVADGARVMTTSATRRTSTARSGWVVFSPVT